jgi:hypothetical protein
MKSGIQNFPLMGVLSVIKLTTRLVVRCGEDVLFPAEFQFRRGWFARLGGNFL